MAEKQCSDVFSNVGYQRTHQNGPTPLSVISDDCINICPLDSMHIHRRRRWGGRQLPSKFGKNIFGQICKIWVFG